MKLEELLERLIWQENELYNLHKLGETFAAFEKPKLVETFQLMAEEELRHRKTLEGMLSGGILEKTAVIDYLESLSLEPMLGDERAEPKSLEELILEALVREKHAYELYTRLAGILDGSLKHIFKMMAGEELKHAYRLRIIYEAL
ncbi:ferritin family protein [Thermococcus celer]|uniref:Rubrerythrin family protein n=1 Tax=Thermococcus celer Vu 13 = JCM 8558 TaxID=1293037 RepID=A0A218P0F5_THECE|nr:ferritin family protein [Thermococcus celer]ASI98405.1 rubrerythrin family protein [Thermococcus celer Vu 13 = JCM 8558]